MVRLGIVADDLTGAMDTGVQFAKEGLHTVVMLGEGALPEAEMVVISTDSRDEPADEAYRRAKEAGLRLAGRAIYKKLDSTLRGNLGPEIEGLLDGLGLGRALVAPAFPSSG
ncbi:MAG: four-carbon acid sugar kinase family protein, partial [Chloroflexota bacterium]